MQDYTSQSLMKLSKKAGTCLQISVSGLFQSKSNYSGAFLRGQGSLTWSQIVSVCLRKMATICSLCLHVSAANKFLNVFIMARVSPKIREPKPTNTKEKLCVREQSSCLTWVTWIREFPGVYKRPLPLIYLYTLLIECAYCVHWLMLLHTHTHTHTHCCQNSFQQSAPWVVNKNCDL